MVSVPPYRDECPECGGVIEGGDANPDAWAEGFLMCDACWRECNPEGVTEPHSIVRTAVRVVGYVVGILIVAACLGAFVALVAVVL